MNRPTSPYDEAAEPLASGATTTRARGTVISYESHEISLFDLLLRYWRLKWLHLAILAAAMVAAYFLIQRLPLMYRSEAVLQYSSEEGQGAQGLLGTSSLVALLGARQSSELTQIIGRLKTRSFLEPLIERFDLLPVVFPELWDEQRQAWNETVKTPLTARDGYGALAGSIAAKENADTGFIDFSVSSRDPQSALTLAKLIPPEMNKLYRQEKIQEYELMIEFIRRELAQTETADHRQLLFALYSKKLGDRIIVNVRPDYPFRVVDAPILPGGPYSPNKRLIYMLSAVAAITLTLLITMLWPARR